MKHRLRAAKINTLAKIIFEKANKRGAAEK